jgi:outer membrane protein OmpA-like peptidoglycan-associated protein
VLIGLFAITIGLSAPSEAAKRPVTYVADTNLTTGRAENFRELYLEPKRMGQLLRPMASDGTTGPRATVTKDGIEISDRIFFAENSHEIKPSSQRILAAVADIMGKRPDIASLEIRGFADALGSADNNFALSVRRTKTIVDELVARGVEKERLTSVGFGENKPSDKADPLQFVIQRWQDVPNMEAVTEMQTVKDDTNQAPKTGSLVISNDAMTWAEVSVNGSKVGVVGPLTDAALHGLNTGLYDVAITHPTGFTHYQAVRTQSLNGPIVPGGRRDINTLPNKGEPVIPTAPAAE